VRRGDSKYPEPNKWAALIASTVGTRLHGPGIRQCCAAVRNGPRAGLKCTQPAVTGTSVCRFHGAGGSPKVREYLRQKRIKRGLPPDRPRDPRWPDKKSQAQAKQPRKVKVPNVPERYKNVRPQSDRDALLAVCVSAQLYQGIQGVVRRSSPTRG
jgi:hypothetical protein